MTIKITGIAVVTLAIAAMLPSRAPAQMLGMAPPWSVKPVWTATRVGYDFGSGAWSAGTQLRVPLGLDFALLPSADVFFLTSRIAWQANLDAAVLLGPRGLLYGGGGIALGDRDAGAQEGLPGLTRAHVNLFTGLRTSWRSRLYVEARLTFLDRGATLHLVLGLDPFHLIRR